MEKLAQADIAGVWAFTPPSFSALMGGVEPAYLKLMMKRLSDQGVLIRAARGIYVTPSGCSARPPSLPATARDQLCQPGIQTFGAGGHFADYDRADLHNDRIAWAVRDTLGHGRVYPYRS